MPPPATAIRAARMNLRQLSILADELLDLRLQAHDLVVRVAVVHCGATSWALFNLSLF